MNENALGSESLSKLLVKYSIPAIISMLIAGAQTIIDGLFVGNLIGENAMASVNIAQPFFQFALALSMMVCIGSLSYMGRSLGENDKDKTQNIFRTSIILLFILAFVLSTAGFFFNKEVARLLGANKVLLDNSALYIKAISIFLLPMFLSYQFGFSNRLINKPDLYFKGMLLSLCLNLIFNYVFIKVFNLGIFGAGLATGLSNSSVLLVVIWPQLTRKNILNIFEGRFDKTTILPVVYNGSSEAITSISAGVTSYVFNTAFLNIAGESGVAAFTIINYISLFSSYIMLGIGDGIGPIVSYNYGAKRFDRVKKILNLSYIIALGVGLIVFILLFFFSNNLVSIFGSNNIAVHELTVVGAKFFSFAFLLSGFNILNSAYFTSIGFAKESAIVSLARGLVFILIGVFTLPKLFGTNGIWLSVPFAEVITLMICIYLLKFSRYAKLEQALNN